MNIINLRLLDPLMQSELYVLRIIFYYMEEETYKTRM